MKITVDVDININTSKLLSPVRSPAFWKFAAVEWHRLYKDYVPMKSGILYQQVLFDSDSTSATITHTAPYAHYQYEGIAYGPNYPIMEGDSLVGYFSMPNRRKAPMGKLLKYKKDIHPKASRKWDKAAEPTQKEKLLRALERRLGKVDFND